MNNPGNGSWTHLLVRLADGRTLHPSAVILDSRTMQSTPTNGAKRRKAHLAVDTPTLGKLLARHVTPANKQDREPVGQLTDAMNMVQDML